MGLTPTGTTASVAALHHPALPDKTAHGGCAATRKRSGDMVAQVKAWLMFLSCGSFCPRAAFAPPAPRCRRVTRLRRYYAALRLPWGVGRSSGSPRLWPTSRRTLLLRRPHVRSPTRGASETYGPGSPPPRNSYEDRQGPPRLLGRPWQPRRGRPPRRVRRPLRPLAVTTTAAFRDGKPLGTREHKVFGAAFPTAQLLVCLRINREVAPSTARLTAGLPGSALAGRDLHPLDDKPNLRKSPQDFLLSDQHCLVATAMLSRLLCKCNELCNDTAKACGPQRQTCFRGVVAHDTVPRHQPRKHGTQLAG